GQSQRRHKLDTNGEITPLDGTLPHIVLWAGLTYAVISSARYLSKRRMHVQLANADMFMISTVSAVLTLKALNHGESWYITPVYILILCVLVYSSVNLGLMFLFLAIERNLDVIKRAFREMFTVNALVVETIFSILALVLAVLLTFVHRFRA
ncbi:hypothetical protein, partial [Alicyclobacillus cellulosilyticus]|uniref:hypothetical protein n=1 Tax=Alicyclobacillus cellulosilyticus TaxID=1003997 RepID=UPI001E36DBB3